MTREPHWEQSVLIGCCPSSGSTLLSVMLDSHPDILSGPELALFSHPMFWRESGKTWKTWITENLELAKRRIIKVGYSDWNYENGVCPYSGIIEYDNLSWYGYTLEDCIGMAEAATGPRDFCLRFFSSSMERNNKIIWVEKSPTNLYGIGDFLSVFPEGRAIVISRDGRDVTCSLVKRGFSLSSAIAIWLVETAVCYELSLRDRVTMIRYEDLVADPRKTLLHIAKFIGVKADVDSMLAYGEESSRLSDKSISVEVWKNKPIEGLSKSSVGRWKNELKDHEIAFFESFYLKCDFELAKTSKGLKTGALLNRLGYETVQPNNIGHDQIVQFLLEERGLLEKEADRKNFHFLYVDSTILNELVARDILKLTSFMLRENAKETEKLKVKIQRLESRLDRIACKEFRKIMHGVWGKIRDIFLERQADSTDI